MTRRFRLLVGGLLDLTRFLLATGQRIGECLAVAWVDLDLDAARVEVNHTVIRVAGHGLIRKDTKSSAGERTLIPRSWAVPDLRLRHARGVTLDAPVFPDMLGGLRDPSKSAGLCAGVLDRAGIGWGDLAQRPEDHRVGVGRRGPVGQDHRRPARARATIHDSGRLRGPTGCQCARPERAGPAINL
ncbi:hypothetical protein N865_12225 [Intrasporangium oryzae NRRL B-24470]|uniref:Tyr recombinase domain-containing protein n=1 Tax=Intrasporangium oryzae NRRL B-24470 TaxID=1386089 RepID=W9G889_9MICO|nr:hypothetical protein N865_12225 [Intrasporangium oryzae NRRL B-24470]